MRRAALRVPVHVAAVVALCLTAVVGSAGMASAAPLIDRSADIDVMARAGEVLRQRLGAAFGGLWLDEATGQLVAGTTDPRLAGMARALGATPRQVPRSAAALDAAMARLDQRGSDVPASVAGWYVDVTTNSVVVSVLAADPAAAAFVVAGAAGDPAAVRVEQVAEAPRPFWSVIGGQAITTPGFRCSAGFNARAGTTRYVITAGHCTNLGATWSGTGGALGTRAGSSFPVDDYGIIQVTASAASSTALVDRYTSGSDVTIGGSTVAPVGARVCRSGSTSGWRCGTVQSLNGAVNYGNGDIVYGLTRTTACAEPGDSGGAFVTQPPLLGLLGKVQAQGMTSGGTGNCTTGGTTWFQPVNEVLATYGVTLYLG